ncbi:MAG TPA: zf-HC2 domain-containing protein [Candidatus Sulfotelmatobacter sp.]|nr:zf-HC2 domain-containing protein [Candidatus Sulfotelmatobacter sp.]
MSGTERMGGGRRAELRCPAAKQLFSPYLDGVVTGAEMLALQDHLSGCPGCHREYQALRRTQQLLGSVGRPKVPADLGLKLRLAISREAAEVRRGRFAGVRVRLENAFAAFMVPATAGFLSAFILFGVAMMYFVAPSSLKADNDVPLVMMNSGPELQPSSFGMAMNDIEDDSLVIEAYVDANGRVQDYRILSDSETSKQVLPEVKRMLIFTTFRPALSMGRPTPSRAVLSFAKISVKG